MSKEQIKEKATKGAWAVIIVAFIGGVALACAQNKTPPVLPQLQSWFAVDAAGAGWLTSVFTIMGLIVALPASGLLRSWGAKKVGVVALACAAVGSLAGGFAPQGAFVFILITRIIEGIGVGLVAVAGPALIAQWFPPKKRGLPSGLWGSWQICSQVILFFSGSALAMNGWQGVWWFTCILAVIACILYAWKVKEPPAGAPNYADADPADTSDYHFVEGLKSRSTWMLFLAAVCYTFACFGFATYISNYWANTFFLPEGVTAATATTEQMNAAMAQSNPYTGLLYAIAIVFVILCGFMLNHISLKRRRFVGAIGMVIWIFILYFAFRIEDPGMLLPYVIIYPIVEGSIPAVFWTICGTSAKKPQYAAVAIGVLNIGLNLGTLFGPPVTGMVIESMGWHEATIPLCIASLLGAIFFCFVGVHTGDEKKLDEVKA